MHPLFMLSMAIHQLFFVPVMAGRDDAMLPAPWTWALWKAETTHTFLDSKLLRVFSNLKYSVIQQLSPACSSPAHRSASDKDPAPRWAFSPGKCSQLEPELGAASKRSEVRESLSADLHRSPAWL